MRVFCAGFNLYQQFPDNEQQCIKTFTGYNLTNDYTDIQLSHTYSIAYKNRTLFLNCFSDDNKLQKFEFDTDIKQISVSENALCLCTDGSVSHISYNENLEFVSKNLVPFVRTESFVKDFIIKISCGRILNCAYSKSGYFFNIPTKLDSKISNVKDLRSGNEHTLVLTGNGLVYSFGGGSRGQLGHGDLEDQSEPKLIDALNGIKIARIACGGWHSIAISTQGDIYVWGWNSNGQLGLKTNKHETDTDVAVLATPRAIDFGDENVVDAACGMRHTIVLLSDKRLFGCGWNKYFQLGLNSESENIHEMNFIHNFQELNIMGLRCGTWNSMILVQ